MYVSELFDAWGGMHVVRKGEMLRQAEATRLAIIGALGEKGLDTYKEFVRRNTVK